MQRINEESQKTVRESYTVIIPLIAGNAEVGKKRYMVRFCSREIFTTHRDRLRMLTN
ncbi:MAG: hypothetical protein FWD82_01030 [Defluviitaleaceae bacterium]|nr:hypothetical protein [Defluviitaleaceae bacterium]